MKFKHLYIGMEIMNNVKIKLQHLFVITKRLEMTLSEVKIKVSQRLYKVLLGCSESYRPTGWEPVKLLSGTVGTVKSSELILHKF